MTSTHHRYALETVSVPNDRLVELAEHLLGGWANLRDQVDERGALISGRLEAIEPHGESAVLLTLNRRMRNNYRGRVPAVEIVDVRDQRVVPISPAQGTKPAARTHVDVPWPTADQVYAVLERS